jgi:carboxypeptidase Taq
LALDTKSSYQKLEDRFRRLKTLGDATSILEWDWATMMPPGGADARSNQLAELNTLRHNLLCATETGDLLDQATDAPDLSDWQQANVREIRRRRDSSMALSEDFVLARTKACNTCETVWRQARADADFKTVLPHLENLLSLVREEAAAKAEVLGLGLYDALLNDYDPGTRSEDFDSVFDDLETFLPEFLGQTLEHQASLAPVIRPQGPFPADKQKDLGTSFMKALGFDFDHGRLDVSLHPFCGGFSDDIRITTRYDNADFTSSLMGVLHETGHALYEMGLPQEWRSQPVGDARGMSLHESQSLLFEMQVCRSPEFLTYAAPLMADAFDGKGPAWSVDNLSRLYSHVEPGFVRVDADEVTYPAHVILRYRLERALIEGDMEATDIPTAWNDVLQRILGITPPSDREGCLQDIHWYDGAWGYFPTYTLGAMMAAQIFDTARTAEPDILPSIAKGSFQPLLNWLRKNVHGHASKFETPELLKKATGRPLDAETFKTHLKRRYLGQKPCPVRGSQVG